MSGALTGSIAAHSRPLAEEEAMPAYVLAQGNVQDREKLNEYLAAAGRDARRRRCEGPRALREPRGDRGRGHEHPPCPDGVPRCGGGQGLVRLRWLRGDSRPSHRGGAGHPRDPRGAGLAPPRGGADSYDLGGGSWARPARPRASSVGGGWPGARGRSAHRLWRGRPRVQPTQSRSIQASPGARALPGGTLRVDGRAQGG